MSKRSTILNKLSVDTLAIGSFDGIHMGHRQLIRKLGDNGALFVIDKDQVNLTPGTKRSLYAGYPCMFYHFLKVKHLSGAEFVALLKKEFPHIKKILVGYDFCLFPNCIFINFCFCIVSIIPIPPINSRDLHFSKCIIVNTILNLFSYYSVKPS